MMSDKLKADIAIIGGTGLYQLDGMREIGRRKLSTCWGDPSSEIIFAEVAEQRVAFLTRHGLQHNIPPHQVNYRANLWALKECGVRSVIAVAAVGGITEKMSPEAIVVPDQLIDYTYGRKHTYYEDELDAVTHIDFTEPYSPKIREKLLVAATNQSIEAINGGVYAATQGPRLETAAEIQKYRRDGADIVGMTGMPEASLARELGLEYACLALVVNWAAGCAGTSSIEHDEMMAIVDKGMKQVKSILVDCLK